MTCPNCGASPNNFGVWMGLDTVRCLRCGFDYNSKGEMSFRKEIPAPEKLIEEKKE
jgi:Zn ribbon nucleic-acid-binding protein